MKKAYYAHCQNIYRTPQEVRDITTIQALGLEVVNPADAEYQPKWKEQGMEFAKHFVEMCDVIIFRALPDGTIPQGVFKEIVLFQEQAKPVIELPSGILRRELPLEATREYLREIGQR